MWLFLSLLNGGWQLKSCNAWFSESQKIVCRHHQHLLKRYLQHVFVFSSKTPRLPPPLRNNGLFPQFRWWLKPLGNHQWWLYKSTHLFLMVVGVGIPGENPRIFHRQNLHQNHFPRGFDTRREADGFLEAAHEGSGGAGGFCEGKRTRIWNQNT